MHDDCMFFSILVTMPRLMEFMFPVADTADGSRSRPVDEPTRILIDSSPLAVNTWSTSARKDKGKAKVADTGMDKVIEPKKPKFITLQTSGPLKIESKGPVP